ncbi:hypothetical protein N7537_006857 [Penicillium hordei]|uniref:Uncharacterized protein n=1 Tax=Penicillium hordei TaxID=40994 RepID=A0AAD6E8T4_9EURO|nr:uncharacterized protein N7537_006857 [Penicillium hordei]KAJ5603901.1 hypothetical protein N7537_006857 [Penicillium hordei]
MSRHQERNFQSLFESLVHSLMMIILMKRGVSIPIGLRLHSVAPTFIEGVIACVDVLVKCDGDNTLFGV